MTSPATLALAFGEGLALIVSPCILPVLPLILGAAVDGSRKRPLGIVTGFILAFTAFAVLSRQAILASGIDAEIIRNASLVLLMAFGLVMLIPGLSDRWTTALTKFGSGGNSLIDRIKGQGYWGGVAIGALIGVVWTPCAGPILGAAILQIVQATSQNDAWGTILAFAAGAGLPMFAIALAGRAALGRLGFLKTHAYAIRRIVGVLMIAMALAIWAGLDLKLVAWQASREARETTTPSFETSLADPVPAPELQGITGWINSDPLTLQQLRGKVVLIDVWTYSCINCIRTLPYVTRWYDQYKDDGFVVIGLHAPEFPFEKKRANVEKAVAEYGINYPVALDNDFATWKAYNNKYWPAHYLIDREGRLVYTHFGEGQYNRTENNIRALLGLKGAADNKPVAIRDMDQSPETYLGYARAERFKSTPALQRDTATAYTFPGTLAVNEWALQGQWTVTPQSATAGTDASLRFHYKANKVFLVMGSETGASIPVDVLIDGRKTRTLDVADQRLYTLLDGGLMSPGDGVIEIRPQAPGLQAYAFTFGK